MVLDESHDAAFSERFSNLLDKEYFNFAAAHFLIFENGEREPLHGHNYRAELEIETAGLDAAQLVADFIQVKPVFKAACDLLDHRVLLPERNPLLAVEERGAQVVAQFGHDLFSLPAPDVVVLPLENTSSELLARWLCLETLVGLADRLPTLRPTRIAVTLSESPGQAARYERRIARAAAPTPMTTTHGVCA